MDIFNCVSNDVYGEGVINNCRWMYSPTTNDKAIGVLSFATANSFDRWANSRIVEVSTIMWNIDDPDFKTFINGLINLFKKV